MAELAHTVQIALLADHPEVLPALTDAFERAWAPYYGPEGPGSAEKDLVASCNRDRLPLAIVAFWEGTLCGTAALKAESVSTHTHLSPWLAALLVLPAYRRRGIGERLIAAVEDKATHLGYDTLYVGTGEGSGTPESVLRKRGWVFMEKRPYFVSEISIFHKRL